jgi:integrase
MSNTQANGRATGNVVTYEGARSVTLSAKLRLPDGTQKKIKLGTLWTGKGRPPAGFVTRKMADTMCRDLVVDAGRGLLTVEHKSGVLFEQAAKEYLLWVEHDRKRRHSTLESYRSMVNGSLIPRFGDRPIDAITAEDIDNYRIDLLEAEKSASTINKRLIILTGIFRRAQKNHGLRENVALKVDRQPIKSSGNVDTFTPDEVYLAAAKVKQPYTSLIAFAAFTGLRMGELRSLRWDDIDFKRRLVFVRGSFVRGQQGAPKSGKVRSVPLVDQARDALKLLKQTSEFTEADDLIFASETGDHLGYDKARKAFAKACEAAGLKTIRFHDLRHTFGTLAVQVFALSDVQAMMGHADISTTMIYVHSKAREDDAAKFSEYIAGQRAEQDAKPKLKLVKDDDPDEAAA